MHKKVSVEVCAYNIAACHAAIQAGAARIELCAGYMVGGTTPPRALISKVKTDIEIPVFPIIRPRGGNFIYSADEISTMLGDINWCRQAGCEGISTGALLPSGKIDVELMKRFVVKAGHMEVTCHKAFDETPDLEEAMEALIAAGCKRILTSGGMPDAAAGVRQLAKLVQAAAGRITIIAGGGIRAANVAGIVLAAGVSELHTSAITSRAHSNLNKSELQRIINAISLPV